MSAVITILASGVVGCRTVAFEPDPVTAAALERNIALNRIAERVETRIATVGERDGLVRFSVGLDTEKLYIVTRADTPGRDVPIQTLDRALFTRGFVPTLKILYRAYRVAPAGGTGNRLRRSSGQQSAVHQGAGLSQGPRYVRRIPGFIARTATSDWELPSRDSCCWGPGV